MLLCLLPPCPCPWSGRESAPGHYPAVGDYSPLSGGKPELLSTSPTFLSPSGSPRCRFESAVSLPAGHLAAPSRPSPTRSPPAVPWVLPAGDPWGPSSPPAGCGPARAILGPQLRPGLWRRLCGRAAQRPARGSRSRSQESGGRPPGPDPVMGQGEACPAWGGPARRALGARVHDKGPGGLDWCWEVGSGPRPWAPGQRGLCRVEAGVTRPPASPRGGEDGTSRRATLSVSAHPGCRRVLGTGLLGDGRAGLQDRAFPTLGTSYTEVPPPKGRGPRAEGRGHGQVLVWPVASCPASVASVVGWPTERPLGSGLALGTPALWVPVGSASFLAHARG